MPLSKNVYIRIKNIINKLIFFNRYYNLNSLKLCNIISLSSIFEYNSYKNLKIYYKFNINLYYKK